jgi:pyruvate/2-oxoglutarate/acetoin dehydrogenase E1 component
MSYKEELIKANTKLALDPKTRFIGYGLKKGRALGTLRFVPDSQIIETPVAENLMMGMAIGMALAGLKPVVFIERMDFLMNTMDALVNHLDKIRDISHGEFDPKVIIRCIVGNTTKPLYTGATHVQNFGNALVEILKNTSIYDIGDSGMVEGMYRIATERSNSAILIEYKDLI